MTKSQYENIKTSHWISEFDSYFFFNFNQSTPQYFIFESVILNVAANFGISYRDMRNSKPSSPLYVPNAICIILIDRIFKHIYNMEQDERKSLIGFGDYQIIEDFHRFRTSC